MNKVPIFPLSPKALFVLANICGVTVFLAVFFLFPPPAHYNYSHTQTGEVTGIRIRNSKHLRGEAPIEVELENGKIIYMNVPTDRTMTIGQLIEVDILEA